MGIRNTEGYFDERNSGWDHKHSLLMTLLNYSRMNRKIWVDGRMLIHAPDKTKQKRIITRSNVTHLKKPHYGYAGNVSVAQILELKTNQSGRWLCCRLGQYHI